MPLEFISAVLREEEARTTQCAPRAIRDLIEATCVDEQ
jgi:hypothetical protein